MEQGVTQTHKTQYIGGLAICLGWENKSTKVNEAYRKLSTLYFVTLRNATWKLQYRPPNLQARCVAPRPL